MSELPDREDLVLEGETITKTPRTFGKRGAVKAYVFAVFRALKKADKLHELNAQAFADQVKAQFPNGKFKTNHVYYYKYMYLKSLKKSKKAY